MMRARKMPIYRAVRFLSILALYDEPTESGSVSRETFGANESLYESVFDGTFKFS